ncbi:MAG: hypothetical protein FJY82_14505 [Candidatus Aminicenantes bacterium]|nr:hypothetical protein [Candidatus Aminicenantes bacterium]
MKRTFLATALSVALTAAAVGTAEAQTYRSFAEEYAGLVRSARLRLGPLLFFPSLTLSNLGYDDNVYYGGPEKSRVRDYHATLSPGLKVYWPFRGTLIAWLRENPEYVFYLRESYQRALKNSWAAGARYLLFHRFALDAEYIREARRQRLSREWPVPVDDVVESWQAGVHFETARRTAFGLTAFARRLGYEEVAAGEAASALGRLFNRREKGAQAELFYQVFVDGYAFLLGRWMDYAFDDPSQYYRNAREASLGLGIRFPLLGRLRGTLNLGYKNFEATAEGLKPYRGLTGDTGLDFQSGRFILRLAYKRDIVFSVYEGAGYYVEDGWGGGLSFRLTRVFKVDYNYEAGRTAYPGWIGEAESDFGAASGRKDRQIQHAFGLTVRLSKALGVNVAWNALRWRSTLPSFDRSRNYLGVNLTTDF